MSLTIDSRTIDTRTNEPGAAPTVAERRLAALERLQRSRPRRVGRDAAAHRGVGRGPRSAPGPYYVIVVVVAVFVMLGLVMVLSSSAATEVGKGNSPYRIFSRQLMWAGFGLVGMLVAVKVPYRRWRPFIVPFAILAAAGMVLPFTSQVGTTINGATAWVTVGSLSFQPSEVLKLATLALAANILAHAPRADGRSATHAVPADAHRRVRCRGMSCPG